GETGGILFAGGGPNEQMTLVRRYQTPIEVNGRVFVAGEDALYAFTPSVSATAADQRTAPNTNRADRRHRILILSGSVLRHLSTCFVRW
ncbi:MAG TPA: hypothetical protein VFZ98_11375, partial [Vicinamibacterales bacterium]